MFRLYFIIIFLLLINVVDAEDIQVVSFNQLDEMLNKRNDTTYLVNFWATWCQPCVKEIPAIEKVNQEYRNERFKTILVSLDFPGQIESRLKPFIREHNIQSEVLLLDEKNPNDWIDKVDSSWTGSIPASIIFNSRSRAFYEESFEYQQLKAIIQSKIIQP